MTELVLRDIVKRYPNTANPSVADMNLQIAPGEMVAFLGPSGCGKSTTLKMIAGLTEPTEGEILFNGNSVLAIPPEKREVSMVFQKALLFPHMTVGENIGFGLRMRKRPKDEIRKKVEEMLALVRLDGYADRRPGQLSGGQEQRVSLARGLVIEPRVFLLDEPLSALDAKLRIEMRELILSIQRRMQVTTIFVTHDQEEAVMLADRIAIMFDGRLQQFGKPEEFYARPATKCVADFFGCTNFVDGIQRGAVVETALGSFQIPDLPPQSRRVHLVVRPEAAEIVESGVPARIKSRIFMGTNVRYIVEIAGHEYQFTFDALTPHAEGEQINLRLVENRLWAVDYEEEARPYDDEEAAG